MAGRDPVALSAGQDETPDEYCANCGLQDQARSLQHLAVGSWKTPTAELPEVRKVLARVQETNHKSSRGG